jgi:hypothetical protein
MRYGLLLLMLIACGCSSPVQPAENIEPSIVAEVGLPVTLKVGEDASFVGTDLLVRFVAVAGDSRCSSNSLILCVWEGDGAVIVQVRRDPVFVITDTLHTTLDSKTLEVGGFVLELLQLDPYPETTEPILEGDYEATFEMRPIQ